MLTHPVPSPICSEFTINDEIVAIVDTLRLNVVIEDVINEPVLIVSELRKGGNVDKYREDPSPATVEANCLSKKVVLTRFTKLGVETRFKRLGVETKFKRFGLETKFNKLGVETKFKRFGLETKFRRLGVETKFKRFGLETKFRRLGVETNPLIDAELTYPLVPNPITVDWIVNIFVPPGPNAVEKEEIALVTKLVEA
jgi:hypothetical protein